MRRVAIQRQKIDRAVCTSVLLLVWIVVCGVAACVLNARSKRNFDDRRVRNAFTEHRKRVAFGSSFCLTYSDWSDCLFYSSSLKCMCLLVEGTFVIAVSFVGLQQPTFDLSSVAFLRLFMWIQRRGEMTARIDDTACISLVVGLLIVGWKDILPWAALRRLFFLRPRVIWTRRENSLDTVEWEDGFLTDLV